jgi:AcrR family transcriptional regulator
MPKIVDHEKKREEIALKAAYVFLELGYKDLGMRQLCTHLDMSKSAIYHYFTSKDAIFKAATHAIVQLDSLTLQHCILAEHASLDEKVDNFKHIFNLLAPRHFQEMKLIMEYIEVIGPDNVAQDESMQMANEKYRQLLASYVDNHQADEIYTLLLGLLNQQLAKGALPSPDYLSKMVRKLLR